MTALKKQKIPSLDAYVGELLTTPTFPKISFVTKVGELGCGVGYYQ